MESSVSLWQLLKRDKPKAKDLFFFYFFLSVRPFFLSDFLFCFLVVLFVEAVIYFDFFPFVFFFFLYLFRFLCFFVCMSVCFVVML